MITFFAALIIGGGLLYFLGIMGMAFINPKFIPALVVISIILSGIGAIGLLVTLIRERKKDRKDDEDVFGKY